MWEQLSEQMVEVKLWLPENILDNIDAHLETIRLVNKTKCVQKCMDWGSMISQGKIDGVSQFTGYLLQLQTSVSDVEVVIFVL